jgi:hypothetical protein
MARHPISAPRLKKVTDEVNKTSLRPDRIESLLGKIEKFLGIDFDTEKTGVEADTIKAQHG